MSATAMAAAATAMAAASTAMARRLGQAGAGGKQ
jgi:hypothetical protein